MAKKYKEGDKLGKNEFELLEYLASDNNGKSVGKFKCKPEFCVGYESCFNKYFEARISDVANNKQKRCPKFSRIKDLRGQKFSRLTVLSFSHIENNNTYWKCKCSCEEENIVLVTSHHLLQGDTKSCGCLQKEHISNLGHEKFNDLINQKFGKLSVIEKTNKRKNRYIIWKCKCDCGAIVEVPSVYLTQGDVTSCGCIKSKGEDKLSKMLIKLDINFERQKNFEKCVNPKTNSKLYFDFYLPDYNCCIEYDGEQHFLSKTSGWNTEKYLVETQYRDSIKNKYCEINKIKLIRIPYWDYNKINEEYLLKLLKEG